jgi:hypothetical protein
MGLPERCCFGECPGEPGARYGNGVSSVAKSQMLEIA